MCRLIESIKVVNWQLQNISYHNQRLNRSRKELFGIDAVVDLSELILLPSDLDAGTYKCRVVYSDIVHNIEFMPYIPRQINTLRLVHANEINYSYKYHDRSCFKDLMKGIEEDDILIIKNGFITDTSFSNIIFYDGSNWVTPSIYLLNGTMRQFLLDSDKIRERDIRPEDLKTFESARLINAMLDIENSRPINIKNIFQV
jgi:4-amino-4-deoxychorismate lyase